MESSGAEFKVPPTPIMAPLEKVSKYAKECEEMVAVAQCKGLVENSWRKGVLGTSNGRFYSCGLCQ